jgi:hypothetical protein
MTHHSLPAHRSTATWAADAFLPMARSTVIPIWVVVWLAAYTLGSDAMAYCAVLHGGRHFPTGVD